MICHTVFDEVDLVFIEVDKEHLEFHSRPGIRSFDINYCYGGRIEMTFASGEYLYMSGDDISIGWRTDKEYIHQIFFLLVILKGEISSLMQNEHKPF